MNLIIIICLWWSCLTFADDHDYIPSDWVDPTDMRYYDPYTKSMRSPKSDVPAGVGNCDTNSEHKQHESREEIKKFEIFLQRFINRFLYSADLKDKIIKPDTKIVTEIPVLITMDELSRLIILGQRITSSKLTELDEILSAVLSTERGYSFDMLTPYLNPIELLLYHMSWEKIAIMTVMATFGVVLWMFAVGRSLRRIMTFLYLVFFMGGLAGNWWKMYQEAVAERFARIKKVSNIPDICSPERNSFWNYLFGSVDDECQQYHKAFQIDPFAQVSPSVVLSETVMMMLIHPLKALGSGIGDFLKGINSATSFPFNVLFLPIVYITSLCALFFFSMAAMGVKLNFWTWLGGVNIGGKFERKTDYKTICDERDLQAVLEKSNENEYALVRVRIIRRYLRYTSTLNFENLRGERGDEVRRLNFEKLRDERGDEVQRNPHTFNLDQNIRNTSTVVVPDSNVNSLSVTLGQVNSFCQLYKIIARPSKGVIRKRSIIRRRELK